MHEIALFILSFVPFRWPDMNTGIGYLQVCVKVTNNFASVQVVGLFSKITNQLAICIFSYQSIIIGPYKWPGGCLNKKDGLTRCGDSHVKNKTS